MYLRWSGGGEEGGPGSPNGCDPLYGGRRRSHTAVDWAIPCNAMSNTLYCNGWYPAMQWVCAAELLLVLLMLCSANCVWMDWVLFSGLILCWVLGADHRNFPQNHTHLATNQLGPIYYRVWRHTKNQIEKVEWKDITSPLYLPTLLSPGHCPELMRLLALPDTQLDKCLSTVN